jgi:triphosphoribosyl-dephospho-CoA synthase
MTASPNTAATLPIGAAATLACIYEATAPKPGNVHPTRGFDDVSYADFVASAVVIGPIIANAGTTGIGQTVLEAVRATRQAVGTNTNLGTLLLLAPLAAVPARTSLSEGIGAILAQLSGTDTRLVYEAIRTAQAGGLGKTAEADVFADAPTDMSLIHAMRLAADRDLVARQYTNGFADVLDGTASLIAANISRGWTLSDSIVHAHLQQMAANPDSLIQRKCGRQVALEASERAAAVLNTGAPAVDSYSAELARFDDWLRADGHRRNPGTTADLIAAGLFVLLREGRLDWTKTTWS